MRIVVTGAAGLTGSAVTRELVGRGHQVTGVTRHRESVPIVRALGAHAIVGDCGDPGTMRLVLAGSDGLVHVAGILLGSRLAATGMSDVPRVLVVSTASIYSRARADVEIYRRNEDALRAAHPSALFVRPTMIYGSVRDRNVHRVISFAKRWRMLPVPSGGSALLQPIHYADLALAIASLAETDGSGVVDAGGPAPITVLQAAETIFAALRLRPVLIPVPVSGAIRAAALFDRVVGSRWSERLRRVREDRVVDNRRLIQLTHVRLRSFEEGVAQEVSEMKGSPRR